jgi:hypothetical protein
MYEHTLPSYSTWERNVIVAHAINSLSIRDRRHIFNMLRSPQYELSPNLLFPTYGFTLGEFAVWYTLGDSQPRKSRVPVTRGST